MASFGGTFDVHGATPQFRLDGFPEEEEEGIPIARRCVLLDNATILI
jgi:hypothetical protein